MRVELSAEAAAQTREIDAWWRANRRAAPDLFIDELEEALSALESISTLGTPYEPRPGVRRLLLRRTHYHVYFVEKADMLYVLAVWGAARGRGPRL